MILLLEPDADAERLRQELVQRGASSVLLEGAGRRALHVDPDVYAGGLPGVEGVLKRPSAHPAVDRAPRVIEVRGVPIGGDDPVLIAGPCAVESEVQIHRAAAIVGRAGGRILRGGAFKPRTSPHAFAGLGHDALPWLREAADAHGLLAVTEVLSPLDVDAVARHVDILQVGSRTMQCFDLLRAVGRAGMPVVLKRGMAATVEEWLLAAEHLLVAGAAGVILCERGIRTFEQPTRNTLDLGAVAWLLAHAGLPVIVDPSHAAGRRELVAPLAAASLAAGAHGVMVEVHPEPSLARSDAIQQLAPSQLEQLGRLFRPSAPHGSVGARALAAALRPGSGCAS